MSWRIYSYAIQESSTLELANDFSRFVTGYFEVINASAPHIYHSALVFTPQQSMVRKLYESHARPFTRVVHGLLMSWDGTAAAAIRPSRIRAAAWSPCNRFIAIVWDDTIKIDVLDSVTLQRLQTLETLQAQPISKAHSAPAFSPDSRILTCSGASPPDKELSVVSWDLQTGDIASVIRWQGPDYVVGTPSTTYFADGKMIGVHCRYSTAHDSILVFDVASGVHIHSYSLIDLYTHGIWIHGESLRFITIDDETLITWEVGSTSDAKPTIVETFPFPGGVGREDPDSDAASDPESDEEEEACFQFLPAPCRLAINLYGKVMVWDVQNSKYLLRCTDARFKQWMSFSSDGRFFACSAAGSGVYLWKESATGDYILHEIHEFNTKISHPLLSRNGKSIIAFGGTTIQLWYTKGYTTPPSSVITRAPQLTGAFLLDFSPDGMLAAVARQRDRTVTVLNPKSGVLQLTIDTDMEVYGLRVIGNTIAIMSDEEFITWDLPTGDRVPGATMTREDSIQSTYFDNYMTDRTSGASISLDSRHLAIAGLDTSGKEGLQLSDGSTGELLAECTAGRGTPFFAPDGRDLWFVGDNGCGKVFRVGGGEQEQWDPEGRVDIEDPPEGYPWASYRGYRVTDNRWILGPDGKRLLMLPPPLQCPVPVDRIWKGQYLALLHGELPEPVILELNQ